MRAIMRRVFVICSCVFALRQDAFNLGEKGWSSVAEMVFCCFSHIGLTARQEPEWRADFPRLHATSPKMNGGKMADRLKFALLSLLVALVTFVAAPSAMADGWDKETVVTFSSPVEVPGQVLLPGTYVFKLADSQSDRGIVQIFSEDHSRLLATILAVPDYRLTPTEKNVISLEERPSGTPEDLHSWFYPGDNYRSEEHTSELQSPCNLVCRLLLEKKKKRRC